ncbi:hypothetical protein AUC61_20780 [Pseudomonas sp. S25]|uniref:Uncharacterized protein n=1 Tax=Pseudomonas maioricensis TaxID=1766623 RepID=A0ABS9ZNW0_9PSED|nr:hypothetical protein [Pseudomonas sp. S25]MCI8211972.1 hypothetical protein [Pseudomonas sp. S25]
MSQIFEKNSNIICALIDLNDGNAEDAIFDMLLESGAAKNWSYKVFWATSNRSSKIITLCKTLSTSGKVKILIEIPEDLLNIRKEQASAAGFTQYTVSTGNSHAMIYF